MAKNLYLYIVLFWLSAIQVDGQDIHFSHIHASPISLNPAMTGMFDDGNVRFIANSRMQWNNFTKGYKTVAGSVDAKLFQLDPSSILGGGMQLYSDKAGDLGFSTNSASLNLSVLKALNRQATNYISFGMQGAMYTNRFDISKMRGYGVDQLVLDGLESKVNYWDISAGLAWYYAIDPHNYYYLGISVFHINQPEVSFVGREANDPQFDWSSTGKILYRRKVIHGGGQFRLAKYTTALPSFIFMDQGPHQEIKVGSFFKFMKDKSFKRSSKSFYLGAWIRWYLEKDLVGTDAIDVSFRYDHNRTILTLSFDINISSLNRATFGYGGPEFSIIKILGDNKPSHKSNRVKCPAM